MKRINKYLFLDVDGVLNSVSWYREEWNKDHVYPQGDFDPKCVDIINDIVSKTDSNLQSVFDKAGLKFQIYSTTPFRDHRGKEIQEWLNSQTEPYVYAILDDDREMLSCQNKFLVRTNVLLMRMLTELLTF